MQNIKKMWENLSKTVIEDGEGREKQEEQEEEEEREGQEEWEEGEGRQSPLMIDQIKAIARVKLSEHIY